jgi:hypothetical protein
MMHTVSESSGDRKNDSADEYVRAANPSDITRLSIAVRTCSSSSTIDISGGLVNG